MKFYKYSVKEKLTEYFGDNIIASMRKPHESVRKTPADQNHLIELCWQYADEHALGLCLDERFLVDTIVKDDYIVYIIQFQEKQFAYLMFMVTEDDPLFSIDVAYAKQLINEWTEQGFETLILRECIDIIYYASDKSQGFHLGTHSNDVGRGSALYALNNINGQDILTFYQESCWRYYNQKLISVYHSQDDREYECLFEVDAKLTTGEEKQKEVLAKGIYEIKRFLEKNAPVVVAYQEFKNTKTYFTQTIAGSKRLVIHVNRRNLISEINVSDIDTSCLVIDFGVSDKLSLVDGIPSVKSIRILDPIQMHGYVIQIEYSEDNIRNYYLHAFETREIPDNCNVDGKTFSITTLESASFDADGNLIFNNGFLIPKHLLYYHSIRQVVIQHTGNILYSQDGINIKSVYRLPLLQSMSHFSIRQYRGFPDECYGPKHAWIDDQGNRLSDITYYSSDTSNYKIGATMLCVEPTAKYGFINADGTWLVPPIYDNAEMLQEGLAKASRVIDGVKRQFLITKEGAELPFNHPVDTESFTSGMVAFNAEQWTGKWPNGGYYHDNDYDIKPGKWGFIDSSGKIVVEPKYVYAVGFWNGGGKHSVVARFVDDKLCWGVIDLEGKEVIPCIYPGLYCRWGEAVAFQEVENGPYGLMDFNGEILVTPQFKYIEAYDSKHQLVTAGDNENALGVYSIDLGRMLISDEYDSIDYYDHIISCELATTCKERYFDYSGKELIFDEYDRVYEADGILKVWKDGKSGAIDFDGNILVPPVLENGMEDPFRYYHEGIIVTGKRKLQGLATVNGVEILPKVFTEIYLRGDFVIASKCTDSNRCINDTLYTTDGKVILAGLQRNMQLNPKMKRLTRETPNGMEVLEIETEKRMELK